VSAILGLAYFKLHVQTALDIVYQDGGDLLVFRSSIARILIGVLALLLAACGVPRTRHTTPQNPAVSPATPNLSLPGRLYRIDESRSELRILIYRAGPLARLGHNHVIINRSIRGVVNLADAAAESVFSMEVPVAGFVVDDAQARSEEGEDFAAAVPDDAKSGTLRNMLSKAVLVGDEFPVITVKSIAVARSTGATGTAGTPGTQSTSGTPAVLRAVAQSTSGAPAAPRAVAQSASDGGALTVTVAINVAGRASTIDVPFNLRRDGDHLSANGSFELRQSALGLTPYSLMLGALQVQDAMTVKFDLVADPD
jgi:hypothetical protein